MSNKTWLERTELLIGEQAVDKLIKSHVLVVGLGGVGSYAAETLVRAGVGTITIIDGDAVDPTNKNRQLQALDSNVGKNKAMLLKSRFLDINPDIVVHTHEAFMEPEAMRELISTHHFDYVLDCIDSVKPKISLILTMRRARIKLISCMGAGGKLDPSKIQVADIKKTRDCKFAQKIRKKLRAIGVRDNLMTVYSPEVQPKEALEMTDGSRYKRSYYGTISYMPAMMGMTMASVAIRRLIK